MDTNFLRGATHKHEQNDNDDDGTDKAAHGNLRFRAPYKYTSCKCQIVTFFLLDAPQEFLCR
jgi:hypothetical protein